MTKEKKKEKTNIKEKKLEEKKKKIKSVDQLTIAKLVSVKTGLLLSEVQDVIEQEQKCTMDYIKRGIKVIKKNYLILTPRILKGKKLKCPLNNEEYNISSKLSVTVRIGEGFKAYISGKKIPEKMCRFIDKTDHCESGKVDDGKTLLS